MSVLGCYKYVIYLYGSMELLFAIGSYLFSTLDAE